MQDRHLETLENQRESFHIRQKFALKEGNQIIAKSFLDGYTDTKIGILSFETTKQSSYPIMKMLLEETEHYILEHYDLETLSFETNEENLIRCATDLNWDVSPSENAFFIVKERTRENETGEWYEKISK